MRRGVLVLATMALAILLAGGVAQAIINGEPDRGPKAHPYVGAYVAKVEGELLPVCSGTLISPKVFLTAGHCTHFEIKKNRPAYVSFDPTYKPGSSRLIKATPYLYPKACLPPLPPINNPGCPPPERPEIVQPSPHDVRYDVGVAVLDKPVRMATYGALPEADLVETLKEGQRLSAVGYGVRRFDLISKPPVQPEPLPLDNRYRATVRLLNTRDPAASEMFVKTTGVSLIRGKGESPCFGDSGGPLFLPDQQTIVGVTSLISTPGVCRGPVYYQRMDLPRVLKWIRSFP